jgi:hypothetical protein
MLYKCTEWQGATGKWNCNCVDNLAGGSGTWYYPARILGVSPAEFISLLIKDFKPDDTYFNPETCYFSWSWKKQEDMRKYKNWINRKAREVNFQI